MKNEIGRFMVLYTDFLQVPKISRKKLYARLPSLLFNL